MDNLARKWDEESLSDESAPRALTAELQTLAEKLLRTVDAAGIAIASQKREAEDKDSLVCIVSVGRSSPPVGARLDPNSGISGRCVRECRTQKSYDTRLDPRVEASVCERLGIRSLAVAPLLVGECCMGLIEAFSARPGHFDAEKIAAMEQAAQSAALLLGPQRTAPQGSAPQYSPELVTGASQPPLALVQQINDEIIAPSGLEISAETHENSATTVASGHSEHAVSAPNFLEEERLRCPHLWALGAALAMLAIVAAIATGGLPRTRVARSATPPAAASQTPSSAQVPPQDATSEANDRGPSKSIATDEPSDDFLLLAQRAKDGDATAQADLAQAYLTGDEVPPDAVKAASWFIMAGHNGNLEAKRKAVAVTRGMAPFQIGEIRFNLGKMYEQGIGSERNLASAYMWFELAKVVGDIRAPSEQARLQKKMNSAQVQEARSRASSWLQSHRQRKGR